MRFLPLVMPGLGALLGGCAAVGQLPGLEPGTYQLFRTNDPGLGRRLARSRTFYVEQVHDSLMFFAPTATPTTPPHFDFPLRQGKYVLLLDRKFDLDVFTIPFKTRPSRGPVPVQLNTNFNAALYFGRRLDFYHVGSRLLAGRPQPRVRTVGLGYGVFTGLGSTIINPDVTNQQTRVAEYEGFVVHAGVATIYDARIFNLGLAVGADQLLGPDGRHWLYQRKPWFGVLFGLDLN